MSESNSKPFLTAEWRHLVLLNYMVEREAVEPLVPAGTVLDTYQGKVYVSLVGFLFLKTKLLGLTVPWHQDFEEVNLRFYVRRFSGEEWRRGVVFIKEIVPKPAVALVARLCYNEHYISLPMRHRLEAPADNATRSVEYAWRLNDRWHHVRASATGEGQLPAPGSLEEFIAEHYWGYAAQTDGGTTEYRVEHPRWPVRRAVEAEWEGDAAALYGEAFGAALRGPPASAFLAEGSAVTVSHGARV